MEFLTWMKETEEMERKMAARASEAPVQKEKKNDMTFKNDYHRTRR